MFGIPLHPLIVHFPIALAVLLPISGAVVLWGISQGATPRKAWAIPAAIDRSTSQTPAPRDHERH